MSFCSGGIQKMRVHVFVFYARSCAGFFVRFEISKALCQAFRTDFLACKLCAKFQSCGVPAPPLNTDVVYLLHFAGNLP